MSRCSDGRTCRHRVARVRGVRGHGLVFRDGVYALPITRMAAFAQALVIEVQSPKPENKELLARALALLSRRDASRAEFTTKMLRGGFDKADVSAAADWCVEMGFLNEARYVAGAARRLSAKFGASRVAHTLRSKGVTEESIAEVTPELKESELERARAVWVRKFREPPVDATAKSKQIRHLQTRGFSFDVIKLVIRGGEA